MPASTMRFRSAARSGSRSTTWSRQRLTVSTSIAPALRPLAIRHRVRTAGDEHVPAVLVQFEIQFLGQVLRALLPGRQQVFVEPVLDLAPNAISESLALGHDAFHRSPPGHFPVVT